MTNAMDALKKEGVECMVAPYGELSLGRGSLGPSTWVHPQAQAQPRTEMVAHGSSAELMIWLCNLPSSAQLSPQSTYVCVVFSCAECRAMVSC